MLDSRFRVFPGLCFWYTAVVGKIWLDIRLEQEGMKRGSVTVHSSSCTRSHAETMSVCTASGWKMCI